MLTSKPFMPWKPVVFWAAVSIVIYLCIAFAAFAQDATTPPAPDQGLPKPEREGPCVSHALFWFPPLEQSICGFTTLEQLFTAACEGGGGTWEFTPGSDARCTGFQRAKPKS